MYPHQRKHILFNPHCILSSYCIHSTALALSLSVERVKREVVSLCVCFIMSVDGGGVTTNGGRGERSEGERELGKKEGSGSSLDRQPSGVSYNTHTHTQPATSVVNNLDYNIQWVSKAQSIILSSRDLTVLIPRKIRFSLSLSLSLCDRRRHSNVLETVLFVIQLEDQQLFPLTFPPKSSPQYR